MLSKNLEAVSRIITDAVKAGARMIFLPEASDFIANRADETASLTKPLAQSEFVQGVRARAREAGVWVSVGVHETVCALPRNSTPPTIVSVARLLIMFTLLKELRPKTRVQFPSFD